jgi:AcrR family transcriptional regulator
VSSADATSDPPAIRPPRQQRSRRAWARILDAGVALLEDGGYEAFTIAALCERAQVPPRAIYDRADTKDALFLAVYEHGIARVVADQAIFDDQARWADLPADELAAQAVHAVADIFIRHAALLRSVVLISGAHPEVYRRGAGYTRLLGDQFAAVVLRARDRITQTDPEAAARASFTTVFSTMVVRVAYGPAFTNPSMDDDTFVDALAGMVQRYLFGH